MTLNSSLISNSNKKRLVVIGNGMAGIKTIETLIELSPERYDICVIGQEPYGNYNRIMLSLVLSGEKSLDEIIIHDREWYQQHGIALLTEQTVVHIDRQNKIIETESELCIAYDLLLIATGSSPAILKVKGHDLAGVLPFRDVHQVNTLIDYSKKKQHAVVLGGGLLGLEAAYGLSQQGMKVTLLHSRDYILNRQLDKPAAKLLQKELEKYAVEFVLPADTVELTGEGHVDGVRLASGQWIGCDVFIMAIGIRPNTYLAQHAGIRCHRGIIVNDYLQTSDDSVYAVGECVEHKGKTFGLVAPLYDQAKVCAHYLAGLDIAGYQQKPTATQLKVSGIQLFSVGDFDADDAETLCFTDQGVYKKLFIKKDHLVGAVLYGETQDGRWFHQLIENKTPIQAVRHSLIFGQSYHPDLLKQPVSMAESSL